MAIPVSRTPGAKANATTGAVSVPLPAAIQAGDIAILVAETDPTGTVTITVTGGGTWTAFTGSPITVASGSKLYVWWRRHAVGNTAPSVQASVDHVCAGCTAYSGCIASGDPVDVSETGTETASDTSFNFATTISTTGPDRICLCICTSSQDSNTGQFTVMTNGNLSNRAEKMDYETTSGHGGGFAFDEGGLAVAGAMGTFAATLSNAWPKAYIAFALKPPLAVVDKTVTPSALAMTLAAPAPGKTATAVKGVTALTMTAALIPPSKEIRVFPLALSMAAAAVAPGRTATAVVAPTTLPLLLAVQVPAIVATAIAELTALALSLGLPAPIVEITEGVSVTVFPAALALALGVPAPDPMVSVPVSALPLLLGLQSPDPEVRLTPNALSLIGAVHDPDMSGDALATPSVLPMTLALRGPAVTGGAVVTPSALALGLGLPGPAPTVGISPSALGLVALLHAPSPEVKTLAGVQALVATLVPPSVVATALTTPSALALALLLHHPNISTGDMVDVTVYPSALGLSLAVEPPAVAAGALVEATVIALNLGLPTPLLLGSAIVLPMMLALALGLPVSEPIIAKTVTAFDLLAAVQAPTVEGTTLVLPEALALELGLPNPVVYVVQPGAVKHRRTRGRRAGMRQPYGI